MRYRVGIVLLLITVAFSLVNSNLFVYASSTAVFLFEAASIILFLYCLYTGWREKSEWSFRSLTPVLFFVLFTLYFSVQGLLRSEGLNYRHYLLFSYLLFFISCCLLFSNSKNNYRLLLYGILFIAVSESLICLFQWAGFLQSRNSFFTVTGTWVNPNVTAMFIAMSFPAGLYLFLKARKQHRKGWLFALLCMFVSLALLQCRTAIIGVVVSSFFIMNYEYGLLQRIQAKNKLIKFSLLATVMLILIPLSYYGYKTKQESADGRLLIWKLSAGMIATQPLKGVGYGMFEHDYNLAQADYIAKGNASSSETDRASHIYMAYNDFLETGVEGGLPAMALLIGLFVSLIVLYPSCHTITPVKKKGTVQTDPLLIAVPAYAGTVSFICMAVFNFSIQALPALVVFLLYAAILCCDPVAANKKSIHLPVRLRSPLLFMAVTCLLLLAGYTAIRQLTMAKDFLQVKQASVAAARQDNNHALEILEPLKERLRDSESYLQLQGNILLKTKNYSAALTAFEHAATITSSPELYLKLGECYQQLGRYADSRASFLLAHHIAPSRMAPYYALMQLYLSVKDSSAALAQAKELLNINPKIVNAAAGFYREKAQALIRQMEGQNFLLTNQPTADTKLH